MVSILFSSENEKHFKKKFQKEKWNQYDISLLTKNYDSRQKGSVWWSLIFELVTHLGTLTKYFHTDKFPKYWCPTKLSFLCILPHLDLLFHQYEQSIFVSSL